MCMFHRNDFYSDSKWTLSKSLSLNPQKTLKGHGGDISRSLDVDGFLPVILTCILNSLKMVLIVCCNRTLCSLHMTADTGFQAEESKYLGIWQEMDRDIVRMFGAPCAGVQLP